MNHMHVTADRYIYNDILQRICMGEYVYGDKLPTIDELCQKYQFAPTTVKKALKQLRYGGFIQSETSRGTHVIFDATNLHHIETLKALAAQTSNGENDLKMSCIIFSGMLNAGVAAATDEVKKDLVKELDIMLLQLHNKQPFMRLVRSFFSRIINQTQNPFIIGAFEDISRQYIFFVPTEEVNPQANTICREIAFTYFARLKELLKTGGNHNYKIVTMALYKRLCKMLHFIIIISANYSNNDFLSGRLYSWIVYDISYEILCNRVVRGDSFPTIPKMCSTYNVNRKTICRAYKILENLGLIKVVPYKGALLIADWNSPKIQEWMEKINHQLSAEIEYSVEALHVVCDEGFKVIAANATEEICDKMEENLRRQWQGAQSNKMMMLATDILITPLMSIAQSDVLHRQYDVLMTILLRIASVHTFLFHDEYYCIKDIYDESMQAIMKLRNGNIEGFMEHFRKATYLNNEMFHRFKHEKMENS